MSSQLLPTQSPSWRVRRTSASSLIGITLAGSLLAGCAETGSGLLASGLVDPPSSGATAEQQATPAAGGPFTTGSLRSPAAATEAARGTATARPAQPAVAVAPLPPAKMTLRAQGFDALAAGDLAKAEQLLRKALDPKSPDWQTHSALGVALASSGKQQEAQLELAKALTLAPDHPSVLNNLALSYALDGRTDQAEQLLRRVARGSGPAPQVKNNLALVVAARGQADEARSIAGGGRPEAVGRANAEYLAALGGKAGRGDKAAAMPVAEKPQSRADAGGMLPSYQLGGPKP